MQCRGKIVVCPSVASSFLERLLSAQCRSVYHVDAERKDLEAVLPLDRVSALQFDCSDSVQGEPATQGQQLQRDLQVTATLTLQPDEQFLKGRREPLQGLFGRQPSLPLLSACASAREDPQTSSLQPIRSRWPPWSDALAGSTLI